MKAIAMIILVVGLLFSCKSNTHIPPNVILVMTDDQGIGDLGCHGNPWLKTPHLDDFYNQSLRLTDFHVSPVCTPTRSAIITGRYPINNGAWATFKGRDAISEESSPTLAELFRSNGYRTALFGKWHLGDNYPSRPTDCGFEVALHHSAGGVGELSDYWGNSYFNDVYLSNNTPKRFEGYCTDIWFNEAMAFIDRNADQPFFIYLATNAPHSPLFVEDKYADPYRELEGNSIPSANFYGMLANIDENFGRLMEHLDGKGLSHNTILIFMTDNGSQFGISEGYKLGYNKGFRGRKGEKVEGGHRVPFFIRWPAADIQGGRDMGALAAHVDLYPTLASLCGFEIPEGKIFDGLDLSGLLTDPDPGALEEVEERVVFIHHRQDWRPPEVLDQTCLMKGEWRLVNGTALYNINSDPFQEVNLAEEFPEIVRDLVNANKKFTSSAAELDAYKYLPVSVAGTDFQEVLKLTVQHAIGDDRPIWRTNHVAAGRKVKNGSHALEFRSPGTYRISCCRWPREHPGPVLGLPDIAPGDNLDYQTIHPEKVRIRLNGQTFEKSIGIDDREVEFQVEMEVGRTMLETWFMEGEESYGVYYTYVEKVQ